MKVRQPPKDLALGMVQGVQGAATGSAPRVVKKIQFSIIDETIKSYLYYIKYLLLKMLTLCCKSILI